jgi:alpha-glucoside transport system permease protein
LPRNWPAHVVLIGLCAIWLLPAFGLLITSFRPFQAVNDSGWWTVLNPPKGQAEYQQACASCHGDDGRKIAAADLSNLISSRTTVRSLTLVAR